ncbi:MAG: hypothetical protein JO051_09255 [Acidobacteriaceae bacterium]|nr:hypothetical protein [Acidobacteriaceae bacterium]
MTIELKPETERIVREELQNGHFQSVEEIIMRGVQARHDAGRSTDRQPPKTAAEAVAHIRQLRQGNRLPSGVTIRDLINEGRA